MIIIYDELRFTTGMQGCSNILKSTNIKKHYIKGKYMTISKDEEKVSEKKKNCHLFMIKKKTQQKRIEANLFNLTKSTCKNPHLHHS